MKKKTGVTMSDVGAACGVSKMAVSLALRNHPSISNATSERIRSTARSLGYKPNPLVAALMSELRGKHPPLTSPTLAYITTHERREDWEASPTFRKFYHGARERAGMLGYKLEEFNLSQPGMSPRRMSEILWTRNIRGVILAPARSVMQTLGLDWSKFASVALGFTVVDPHIHRVANHHIRTMKLVLDELFSCGYRRLGVCLRPWDDARVNYSWLAGLDTFRRQNRECKVVPELIFQGEPRTDFLRWFRKHRPDAIATLDVEVPEWLAEIGCRVPEEVGVGNLSVHPEAVEFSGAVQNCKVIGATAVDVVTEEMNRNHLGMPSYPKIVYIESIWKAGNTTRQPQAA